MKTIPASIPFTTGLLAGLVAICAAGSAFAENAAVNSTDKSFLTNSYEDGLAEVTMGTMGQRKTGNADVKAFAEHMIIDHSKANAEIKALADAKKVELPTDQTLMAKGKAKLLDAKTGADFDKAFADGMVSDHKKAVQAFEKEANEAQDADVKSFAAKTLLTLKSHLTMAEDLQNKVGK